jgi:putative transposase
MSVRKIALVEGEYYHLYSRGNSKQKIFLDDNDYKHFIKCLFVCNTTKKFKFSRNIKMNPFDFDRENTLVSIGAWVLMPNHFHLYVIAPHQSEFVLKDNQNRISEFMRKVLTAYSLYFNKKYNRTGGLFEGRFKSVHVNTDNQAKYLFSYIHLNPIKIIQKDWKEEGINDAKEALKFLDSYKWSSYYDYNNITKRSENLILKKDDFPTCFVGLKDFNKEILTWLTYNEEEI